MQGLSELYRVIQLHNLSGSQFSSFVSNYPWNSMSAITWWYDRPVGSYCGGPPSDAVYDRSFNTCVDGSGTSNAEQVALDSIYQARRNFDVSLYMPYPIDFSQTVTYTTSNLDSFLAAARQRTNCTGSKTYYYPSYLQFTYPTLRPGAFF
jgi:hypothetical protein